ncbi:peptide chain release factor N(5)-glutamine methyltransferase [Pinibacter aurantiacus]|uniref:peptide chain release factor N(5)-glutamine methyltransferase n=1 Tax=Pinibacter aurantiacus TaxID=2851599 RepID=A0A9E2SEI5_9BACT|nr:peptide chain release factor N(5)-glutamine methyltransferase [Pinibacter aurantiacus]MBV4359624.1 peptide chain release factor N(5)-glutamine methyltransferase [Pinibacter aurantiacus]
MTLNDHQQQLLSLLSGVYDAREAANIADWVMENITGWKKIDRVVNKHVGLTATQMAKLEQVSDDLLKHRPIQYTLGEAWFYGMKFYVNESVLIPRPETEELVEWVVNDFQNKQREEFSILDIGSGSGCIPVAIKKNLAWAKVKSCDISEAALHVARQNAATLNADVQFHQLDFLNTANWQQLGMFDVVVSNPPYIPNEEIVEMEKHVVEFEPHLALFVENENPLIFYKAIADFSAQYLKTKGAVYMETHMALANEVAALFTNELFETVVVRQDLQGKDRMVKAIRK